MTRTYLLSYESEIYEALNSNGTTYLLKLKKVWLFGLFTTYSEMLYPIPGHHPIKPYFERWDELIKTKKPLK